MLKSKLGYLLASVYLAVALIILIQVIQCQEDFFCGVIAIPLMVPAGFVYLALFSEYLPSPAILQWPLLVATLMTNTVFYYLVGLFLSRLIQSSIRHKNSE